MKVVMDTIPGEEANEARFVKELQRDFPDVTFQPADTIEEQERQIADADVYYGWPPREVFLAAERLRWLHVPGTGIDRITTIPELIDSDVVLTNARGPHASPMADHVFGMMIALTHRLREQWDDQQARRWDTLKYYGRIVELSGRTMGILALGDIGMAIARRAHGFDMEVYAVDVRPGPAPLEVKEVWGPGRLDELMQISDWFVVTAPLTGETRGLIDRGRIGLLKNGAYVVVISRGGIVDEEALIDSLRSGRLAGAALDATAEEPLPDDSPLWDMDNVVLSPHASALTPEMSEERRRIFRENLRRFLANEPFLYVCDKSAGF